MLIGKRPRLAVNLVTDKLRCCLGHQCFFHYLSGFMLHLDHLFILDRHIRVIQQCAYRWCAQLFTTLARFSNSGSVRVDCMIKNSFKKVSEARAAWMSSSFIDLCVSALKKSQADYIVRLCVVCSILPGSVTNNSKSKTRCIHPDPAICKWNVVNLGLMSFVARKSVVWVKLNGPLHQMELQVLQVSVGDEDNEIGELHSSHPRDCGRSCGALWGNPDQVKCSTPEFPPVNIQLPLLHEKWTWQRKKTCPKDN